MKPISKIHAWVDFVFFFFFGPIVWTVIVMLVLWYGELI